MAHDLLCAALLLLGCLRPARAARLAIATTLGICCASYYLDLLLDTAQETQNFRRLNDNFYVGSCGFRSVSLIIAGLQMELFFGRSILARKWLAKMTKTGQK